jgi:hypothetical protein
MNDGLVNIKFCVIIKYKEFIKETNYTSLSLTSEAQPSSHEVHKPWYFLCHTSDGTRLYTEHIESRHLHFSYCWFWSLCLVMLNFLYFRLMKEFFICGKLRSSNKCSFLTVFFIILYVGSSSWFDSGDNDDMLPDYLQSGMSMVSLPCWLFWTGVDGVCQLYW